MNYKTFIKKLLIVTIFTIPTTGFSQNNEVDTWQQVYDAREKFYTNNFGKLPDDIMKSAQLFAVWPAGGFYVIPAEKIQKGLWVYSTFGLTNSDMPASMTATDIDITRNDHDQITSSSTTLKQKTNIVKSTEKAGYGYEVMMIAKEDAQWPLWFMQWSANFIFLNDVDLLAKVEKYNGLTVEKIPVGNDSQDTINVLIAKAQKPLPREFKLPNGNMKFLIATVITDEEMNWSIKNGREALLQKLIDVKIGQISDRNRASIIQ